MLLLLVLSVDGEDSVPKKKVPPFAFDLLISTEGGVLLSRRLCPLLLVKLKRG